VTGGEAAAAASAPPDAARRSLAPEWLRVVLANGKARTGLTILGFLVAVSIAAPWLAGSGTVTTEVRAAPPSWRFPFGTTNEGFDVLSQVLRGGRLTLLTVAGATLLAMLMAVTAGLLAGTFGGWVDAAVSSVTNGFLVIPMLPMALLVAGILPRSQNTTAATIGMIALATWAAEARVLRSQALSLRERDFVAATEVVGEPKLRIAFLELLPCMGSRIAAGFFFVAIQSMVVEATLDYLAALSRGRFSLGDVGGATWASTLASAQNNLALFTGTWWHFFFPAAALLLLGTGLVLTMHGLEELADPRLRGGTRLRLRLPRVRLPRRRVRTTPTVVPTPMPRVPLSEHLARLSATLLAIVRVLGRRLPLYAVALWLALTVCYALPQLTTRSQSSRNPQPLSPAGYPHFLATVLTGHVDQGVPGIGFALRNSLPFSLALVGVGVALAFICGIVLGAIAGWRRGGLVDTFGTTGTAALWALPGFVAAGLGLYFLGLELGWFPLQFAYDVSLVPAWSWTFAGSAARHAELPVLVLFVSSVGYWALNMRNVMTSVSSEEYIQLARVKGLPERQVMWRYAGRNAILPVITGFAVAFGLAIGGIPAIEAIFSYQGGGWQLQQAAMNGNFPLEQGIFICIVAFALVVNLLADVVQVVLDPRLR
jgi:peptide/nickel transport system permease protein